MGTLFVLGHSETPLEFIKRNGPTLTHEIAQRFNMDHRAALKAMKWLEKHGEVTSRRVAFEHGAGLQWSALIRSKGIR